MESHFAHTPPNVSPNQGKVKLSNTGYPGNIKYSAKMSVLFLYSVQSTTCNNRVMHPMQILTYLWTHKQKKVC